MRDNQFSLEKIPLTGPSDQFKNHKHTSNTKRVHEFIGFQNTQEKLNRKEREVGKCVYCEFMCKILKNVKNEYEDIKKALQIFGD